MPPHEAPPPQPQATGMWGTISNVLTSYNAVYLFVFVAAITVLLGILAKLGVFSINRKGLRIGRNTALSERMILKKQLEYTQKYCLSMEPQLARIFRKCSMGKCPKDGSDCGADKRFYFKYLAMIMSNEAERSILLNNIRATPDYIKMRCFEIKACLLSAVGNCPYDAKMLDEELQRHVTTVVEHLELIRKGHEPSTH